MDILLEHENDLDINWHPGCSRMGHNTFSVGGIGRLGPGVSMEEARKPITITEVPKCLVVYISIKKSVDSKKAIQLCDLLNECFNKLLEQGDGIEIKGRQIIKSSQKKIGVKMEFLDDYNKIAHENQKIRDKCNELIHQLESLGCAVNDASFPKLVQVPDEYYIYENVTEVNSRFDICCDSQTRFYQFLKDKGLLEKYFPEWYRNGCF